MNRKTTKFISVNDVWIKLYRIRWNNNQKYKHITVLYTDDFKFISYKSGK